MKMTEMKSSERREVLRKEGEERNMDVTVLAPARSDNCKCDCISTNRCVHLRISTNSSWMSVAYHRDRHVSLPVAANDTLKPEEIAGYFKEDSRSR